MDSAFRSGFSSFAIEHHDRRSSSLHTNEICTFVGDVNFIVQSSRTFPSVD